PLKHCPFRSLHANNLSATRQVTREPIIHDAGATGQGGLMGAQGYVKVVRRGAEALGYVYEAC
ncbi:MAG: hypothetical protein WCP31_04240, partial [Chloroflexales bacterium]